MIHDNKFCECGQLINSVGLCPNCDEANYAALYFDDKGRVKDMRPTFYPELREGAALIMPMGALPPTFIGLHINYLRLMFSEHITCDPGGFEDE